MGTNFQEVIIMFDVVFSNFITDPRRMNDLDKRAHSEITIRGYDLNKVSVPSELKDKNWFLPVNLIVGDYCPTGRYLYLKKIKNEIKLESTWEMYTGKIIDSLYQNLFERFRDYLNKTKIGELCVREELQKFSEESLSEITKDIEKDKENIINFPKKEEVDSFLNDIKKILRYEVQLCSSIIDFKISIKEDINLKSEAALLFPFNFKVKFLASDLGFSKGVEPDFILANKVVGEIKTGEWQEFFNLALAAYALAYENEHKQDMNLGVIVNPILKKNRTVPLYLNSQVIIIEDRYRKAVLFLRNKKLEMMKRGEDPNIPKDKKSCYSCGYFNYCWGKT